MPTPANLDPASLPDDPAVLRALLQELLVQLKEKDKKIENLTFWVKELRERTFGRKTESLTQENQRLLQFLVEGVAARKPEPQPAPPPPAPDKKGHGRTRIPPELLRDVHVYDVPKSERRCGCCRKQLVKIGEVVSEQVEYVPASLHAKRHVRIKYGCPDSDCRGTVILADLPPQPVPKCKAAEGMLAYIVWQKYGLHLPLYRLEESLALHRFLVHRSTLWEWVWGTAEAFEPVYQAMKKAVQASPVVETDETPVRLWDDERQVMTTGRQWVYNTPEHTVYEFTADRKKKHPEAFLAQTRGTVLSDAYSAYRSIAKASGGRIVNAFCMAHLRRLFYNALDSDEQRAMVGMAYIRALYDVEDEGKGRDPAALKKLRQRKSRPILAKFKGWLGEQGPAVLPRSLIGKAIAYALRNWKELCCFVEDPRIRIDNNRSEQQLKPIAIGRKNWQRYQSERGGKAAAILSSLIASCRRHKKNPFEYLRDVLRRLSTHPARKILELTPARWKPRPNTS